MNVDQEDYYKLMYDEDNVKQKKSVIFIIEKL